MTYNFYEGIRWDAVLEILVPGAVYTGLYDSGTEAEYNGISWSDGRTKPTWAQITNYWFLHDGVDWNDDVPGDYKISDQSADHGYWLHIPHDGRTLLITEYPLLAAQYAGKYNSLYPGINAATHFGLPIPDSRFIRLPGTGVAIGDKGGAVNVSLTTNHMPEHDHDLNDSIGKITGTQGFIASILGGVLGTMNVLAQIGSGEKTGKAGQATPTPVPTIPPYIVLGNLFVHRGKGVYEELSA